MFTIVENRDFHRWSYDTIDHRWRKIDTGPNGRKQLWRMRKIVKRGGLPTMEAYRQLKREEIAMEKAEELGLHDFNASRGWLYYFKLEHNLVDRHVDKVGSPRSFAEREELENTVARFCKQEIPRILQKYSLDKIWNADQIGLELEVKSGRTLTIKGTKKVVRQVQRESATTHSYTAHINLKANGTLADKLPIVLYEPAGAPQKLPLELEKYK